jgi:hypothetical protein
MRKITLFTAAFAVASAAFWGTMLTNPPRTHAVEAAPPATVDPGAMTRAMSGAMAVPSAAAHEPF